MHICYICREYHPSLRGGGIASYIKEVASGMVQRGHMVTVICASDDTRKSSDIMDSTPFDKLRNRTPPTGKGNLRIIRLAGGDFVIPQAEGASFLKKFRVLYRFNSYRKRIRDCVKTLKDVDVIEVPEYGAESLYLHDLNIPIVVRLHTPCLLDHSNFSKIGLTKGSIPYYWQSLQELKEMKWARFSTSCSTSLKEWGVKYACMNPNNVKIIYNPIDISKWIIVPAEPLNHLNRSKSLAPLSILFAGTICDWKGCEELAKAGLILEKDLGRKFKISFVGKTGSWSEWLNQQYIKYEWFDYVGKVPREELMKRYAAADVVVFPSWWENMPMVCIEAMLQGALVIGSKCGGMSEIIEDGKSGYLVEPKNPEMLASKIAEVLSLTDEKKQSVRQGAVERIKNDFSTDFILQQMEGYFKEVIKDFKNER